MNDEKKYNEALERARKLYEQGTITESLCYVFPELKESEDERIRKELLEHCKNQAEPYILTGNNCPQIQSWIAWLEKQKVLTTEENLQGKEDVLWCIKQAKKHAKDENEMGTCWFAEEWLEKQGEQKPAEWSEKDESTTEDLGEYINELSKQFPEVSFAKLSRIAMRVAKWQKENLWKPADGEDLPIFDREVIALLDNGKVVFAHRPPEYWDGKNIITGEVTRYYPKTYDKGGWNIPFVKYWLDVELPKVEED